MLEVKILFVDVEEVLEEFFFRIKEFIEDFFFVVIDDVSIIVEEVI